MYNVLCIDTFYRGVIDVVDLYLHNVHTVQCMYIYMYMYIYICSTRPLNADSVYLKEEMLDL